MNKFHKISKQRYEEITGSDYGYEKIVLPKRATTNSAGYDFVTPVPINLLPNETLTLCTGIQVQLDPDKCLILIPRSSLGYKYKLQMNNTVGLIDADFYNADGVISVSLQNRGNKPINLEAGDRFVQGIIMQYFKTDDDETKTKRTGGIGSTGV